MFVLNSLCSKLFEIVVNGLLQITVFLINFNFDLTKLTL